MKQKTSHHHRKPKSLGGAKTTDNISMVSPHEHRAWHTLFENKTPIEICKIINDIWLDKEYYFVCIKKDTH